MIPEPTIEYFFPKKENYIFLPEPETAYSEKLPIRTLFINNIFDTPEFLQWLKDHFKLLAIRPISVGCTRCGAYADCTVDIHDRLISINRYQYIRQGFNDWLGFTPFNMRHVKKVYPK